MTDQNYEYIAGRNGGHIKAWTKGVPFDYKAREQAMNLASMPFIHKHVAIMPDVHLGKGATIGSVIPTSGAIIPASVGVDIGCFVGDTRVPLLDGTQRTLKELTDLGEEFWVYSVDQETLRVVPGKAKAVQTRRNAALMEVVVSGGERIVCTPDHEFMLVDGTYRRADKLAMNDSLMPLYRRWETRDGYEHVSTGKGRSTATHTAVYEAIHGPVPDGSLVHHKNHVHFDNRPDNLVPMDRSEHSTLHRRMGHRFNNADPELQRKRREGIATANATPERQEKMREVGIRNITEYMATRPEHFREAVAGNGERGAPYLRKFNTSPRPCDECDYVARNPSDLRWHKVREHTHSNHKVMGLTSLVERADVYCLQVEQHHNFALAAGVFVHNCGMSAVSTSLIAKDLPDSLVETRKAVEDAVPVGRAFFRDGPHALAEHAMKATFRRRESLARTLDTIVRDIPALERRAPAAALQLGTLGGGNHFIELCLDEEDRVWIMLHSGSRGIGNAIGQHFISLAQQDMRTHFINLPDKDLAYLVEGTEHFDDYVAAVAWAQEYAAINRKVMLENVIGAIRHTMPAFTVGQMSAVNCHHNYIEMENHFGRNVWVTRKGAVRAREGDLGIIPGSMGARSFIVRGLGNADSFHSCSHGAGRVMSRSEAKRTFTADDHAAATEGVECRKDAGVIDETPGAYKDIQAVMDAQSDLVEIVHTLKQVMCVKG